MEQERKIGNSDKSQTAVEWLIEKLGKYNEEMIFLYQFEIEQAKQMEKEQIVNFGNDLLAQNDINYIGVPDLAEQYYNEVYGGQGSPDTSPNTQNK